MGCGVLDGFLVTNSSCAGYPSGWQKKSREQYFCAASLFGECCQLAEVVAMFDFRSVLRLLIPGGHRGRASRLPRFKISKTREETSALDGWEVVSGPGPRASCAEEFRDFAPRWLPAAIDPAHIRSGAVFVADRLAQDIPERSDRLRLPDDGCEARH